MKFFDRTSNPNRVADDVAPIIHGLLENKQLFDENGDDRPFVTNSLKYTRQQQYRRSTSEYEGNDEFVESILQIIDFQPLDFQVQSWKTVNELDAARREDDRPKAAVFSAPTGFGKTEAFLGPLYELLRSGRQNSTIIVYPRRALLQNQLERVLEHIHTMRDRGPSDLSVGVYTGGTPYRTENVEDSDFFEKSGGTPRFKLANCWCGTEDRSHAFEFNGSSKAYTLTCEHDGDHSFTNRELTLSRTAIRNDPPDILLTTLESLELFALKPNYDIIDNVDSIVLDEVHLYTGLRGAHASKIINNLNEITEQPLLWLSASATTDSPTRFAKKLFDLSEHDIESQKPHDSDYADSHDDIEHYYFLISPEEGPGASAMMIQQLMFIGHSLLQNTDGDRGKILSFIDSISQINQKQTQLVDADHHRRLWQYHRSGDGYENWNRIAEEMDFDFLDEGLSFEPVYSDIGFDAEAAASSDVLLSTSFLEVGIDVGDISVVTQYRTPQDLSSFIQRTGRAAREEDMDSHIFVFLSNLTGDANMFYRAERFLHSELRTPLKTDNKVVDWIHRQLGNFYEVGRNIGEERLRSPREEELAFFEQFVRDSLGYDRFYEFLTEPGTYLDEELDIAKNIDQPLLSGPPLNTVQSALKAKEQSLESDEAEIQEYIDIEDNQVIRAENAFDEYLKRVQDRILTQIRTYEDQLDRFEEVLVNAGERGYREEIGSIRQRFEEAHEQVNDYRSLPSEERVERYHRLLANIAEQAAKLMAVRAPAARVSDESVPEIELGTIDELQDAVGLLAGLAGDEKLEQLNEQRRQMYYLKQAVDQLASYRDLDKPEEYRVTKPYLSVWYVKDLLRAAYYFDRYLRVDGRSLGGEVWYVPPNYFESSGQFFTVFRGEDDRDGSEEPLDSIVHSFAPYRSEYQADTGSMQLFMPDTGVVQPSGEDGHSTVRFDFSDVPTDRRPNMQIPEEIRLKQVDDLSEESAQNIVRYCPECLRIISDLDSCLLHKDSALGKIHSDPQVQTLVRSRTVEERSGGLALSEVTGDVMLEGVTLNITPAAYKGEYGYGWADEDRIQREIQSPDPPLGFTLDTRAVELELSSFIESLDEETIAEIAKHKDLEEVDIESLAYHTAAHFLMGIVSDVSGVNETMLFYGMNQERGEVFVFERTEGGQGIVDLFYEELQTDPGNVLEAINRTTFNPQVLNERLWATRSVIDELPTDRAPREEEALAIVTSHLEIPYHDVQQRVAQEFISTADRAVQLGQVIGEHGLSTAYRVKHEVAVAQIEGKDEFPSDSIRPLDLDLDSLEETIQSVFVSPDIDGCVENLHLTECISGHDQTESLSYVLLEALHAHLTQEVPVDEGSDVMFDNQRLPAAEINDTNIFITF